MNCMPDSEIYAIQWESDTILNLVKFFMVSCKDVLMAKKIVEEFNKICVENPFNPAFIEAQSAGRYLAQLVCELFPYQFVNIYGYSLGTELIKEFVKRMIEKKKESMLNKVYLMGGVSDIKGLENII